MNTFDLPPSTEVGRVIPKNAFDEYTDTKQKRLFIDFIQRITWTHKLAPETINLEGKEIQEIQFFYIALKQKHKIPKVLAAIDKAIPYHIIFWVEWEREAFLSTSLKHAHPTNNNISVIDQTFSSAWFSVARCPYELNLRESLDYVVKDLCIQMSGNLELKSHSMMDIVRYQQEKDRLNKEITKLKRAVAKARQFNRKVELNLRLKKAQEQLKTLHHNSKHEETR